MAKPKDCKHLHLNRVAGPGASLLKSPDEMLARCIDCHANFVVRPLQIEVVHPPSDLSEGATYDRD